MRLPTSSSDVESPLDTEGVTLNSRTSQCDQDQTAFENAPGDRGKPLRDSSITHICRGLPLTLHIEGKESKESSNLDLITLIVELPFIKLIPNPFVL